MVEFFFSPNISQFYCWKNHKNLWKIVAELVEFVLEKKKLSKAFPILLFKKPKKLSQKNQLSLLLLFLISSC
jgi:hypothetical protein